MTNQEWQERWDKEMAAIAELRRSIAELRETQARESRKTERTIRQTNKQLGELGNKFGSFAEGLALPSMEKVLYEHFGANKVLPRAKSRKNGRTLEIDVLAYGGAEAYIVEVKSHLTREGIEQILKTIADFPRFFEEHAHRRVYGIIAAVDIAENVRQEALKRGLYLARISDDTFKLQVPRAFKPQAFGPFENGSRNGSHAKGKSSKRSKK